MQCPIGTPQFLPIGSLRCPICPPPPHHPIGNWGWGTPAPPPIDPPVGTPLFPSPIESCGGGGSKIPPPPHRVPIMGHPIAPSPIGK